MIKREYSLVAVRPGWMTDKSVDIDNWMLVGICGIHEMMESRRKKGGGGGGGG